MFINYDEYINLLIDLDECREEAHSCHDDAVCSNTYGSHTCQCKTGYSGNGQQCTGKSGLSMLYSSLQKHTVYICYVYLFSDIDECITVSPCNVNATCTNIPGSFVCQCIDGFSGDGIRCDGKTTKISFN
jgi:hypothetical protein